MEFGERFDVIVVGGGHAGVEAALAAARCGASTLLLTHQIDTLGQMSCNPAIGGIGKGHLVREIDALGGAMGRAADRAGIHFRVLNASKGAAVRATRAQADRNRYRQAIRQAVEEQPRLCVFEQSVDDLRLVGGRVGAVVTRMGVVFRASAVVLTVGTFLAGRIHIGQTQQAGGRAGERSAERLAQRLRGLGLGVGRLKTGTPPRLDGRTLDTSQMRMQPGDEPRPMFSFMSSPADHPRQVVCHVTATNERSHEIIRANLHRSPLYGGKITGPGPRYCPSLEDKVVRFADRASHQVFVEPEGLDTFEVYPNGISTSLPFDVQQALVRSIAGFERAHITRPGYAIEYDFFDPRSLYPSLESRLVEGLYLAGQINGTTGYEEAAAQGLVAGLNAARAVRGLEPWWPRRDEAYIGVLIDDLVTRGTLEPYRMFTSRAEYRLLLREDNADLRLTPVGRELGLVDDERLARFEQRQAALEREQARLQALRVRPGTEAARTVAGVIGAELSREQSAMDLLRRPGVGYRQLMAAIEGAIAESASIEDSVAAQLEIQARYAGYIERQREEIARQRRLENTAIPDDIDYQAIGGLSSEVRQTLAERRPVTIGQAGRLPGMTPAAVSILLLHLRKHGASPSLSA